MELFVYFFYTGTTHTFFSGGALIKRCQFLKNATFTKQIHFHSRPQIRRRQKAGTFLRFDIKLFLIFWLIAALIRAVLKLADAPNIYIRGCQIGKQGPSFEQSLVIFANQTWQLPECPFQTFTQGSTCCQFKFKKMRVRCSTKLHL